MRFHVEMETERLMKAHGLPVEEARRRALVSFGGVEKFKEAGHDVYGLRWLDALLLDSRFSLRMLRKHPGLTMVGAFAMAVAIAVGATAFEAISDILDSVLPLPGGDGVVELEFVGSDPSAPEQQVFHEFAAPRTALTTVEHFSAYRNAQIGAGAGLGLARYPYGAGRAATAVPDANWMVNGGLRFSLEVERDRPGRAGRHATPADRGRDHGTGRAAGDVRSRTTQRADSGSRGTARGSLRKRTWLYLGPPTS